MSVYGPASAFLLVGGRNISGDTFTLDETTESMIEETHGLGDSWEEHLPIGMGIITLEAAGGIYDDRVGGIMEALQAKGQTKQLVAYGMNGHAIGTEIVMMDGTYAATWKRMAARDGLTKAHATHRLTGGYQRGLVLHGLSAITTDPGPGYTASVDQAAQPRLASVVITSSSVASPSLITTPVPHGLIAGEIILISGHAGSTPSLNGGAGYAITYVGPTSFTIPVNVTVGGTGGSFQKVSSLGASADLHVPAVALGGYTNVAFAVQHSADNASFVDVSGMSFTAVTGLTSERKTVLTQVNRYTRLSWDFVGAGAAYSITPFVSLTRP